MAGGVIAFLPQLLAWKILYGSCFAGPMPYLENYSEFHLLRPQFALEVLFSSNHGLFFWHPLLLLGVMGLWFGKMRLAGFFLGFFAATWYLTACWQVWYAGASFGNRLYLSILMVFAVGAATMFSRWRKRGIRLMWTAVLILGILWNGGLLIQYATGMIPRQGNIAVKSLITNQFTTVPDQIRHLLHNDNQTRREFIDRH